MIPARLLNRLRRGVPARLFAEPIAFSYPIDEMGFSLEGFQLSTYSPSYSPYCFKLTDGRFVVAMNSYLTSFVADCSLVILSDLTENEKEVLLRYNLKKFYAEQILNRAYVMIGRGLLLETLLYEEHLMVSLMNKRDNSTDLKRQYEEIVNIAGSILLFHEMAHMIQANVPDFQKTLFDSIPRPLNFATWECYERKTQLDLEADAFATGMIWHSDSSLTDKKELAELLTLCHSLLACMNSIAACAELTAEAALNVGELDINDNIFESMTGGDIKTGIHPVFDARGKSAIDVVTQLEYANTDKNDGSGRMTSEFEHLEYLYSVFDKILEGETATYRGKCEMLAHAFHNNKRGFDFLVWRSKTFSFPEGR